MFCAVRGALDTFTCGAPVLLPSSLMAPPLVPAAPAHRDIILPWPQETPEVQLPPVDKQLLQMLLPHLPAPVSELVSFKPCSVRDMARMVARRFPGRKAPGLVSCRASHQMMAKVSCGLQVYEKEENTQAGFAGLFASPLQREVPSYGAVMVSPVFSASLLGYKKGRWEPKITTHRMASGQSQSHYLHRVPSEVNGL